MTPTSATVRLELASPGPASVEVQAEGDGGAPVKAEVREALGFHVLPVSGLRPAQRYRYTVKAGGATATGSFSTAPGPTAEEGGEAPFRFLVYGDNRTDDVGHASVVRAMYNAPSDFLLHTGDYVENGGSAADWQSFFDIEQPLLKERPLMGCIGNHELMDGTGGWFLRYFGPAEQAGEASALLASMAAPGPGPRGPGEPPLPLAAPKAKAPQPLAPPGGGPPPRARFFTTFRWGMARFFLLNAFDTWIDSDERAWLEGELTKADAEPGLRYRFAVLHHSPYSAGPHGSNARMQSARIPELLLKHKVDLVFGGHDHLYERGDARGLRYVISGGGGAPLYRDTRPLPSTRKVEPTYHFAVLQVDTAGVRMEAKRIDGSTLETCGFAAGAPGWDCDAKASPAPAPAVQSTPAPPPPASRCACRAAGIEGSVGRPWPVVALLAALGVERRRRRAPKL